MPTGTEIERKFVVETLPSDLARHPSDSIEQGYLALDDGVEVRLRHYRGHSYLTIKGDGAGSRLEEEMEIDHARLRALWPLTSGRRIEKVRYRIPAADGLTIELDVYRGALAGLVTAEVEFDTPEQAGRYAPPAWLGPEVTDDPRYKNRRLATEGLPGPG